MAAEAEVLRPTAAVILAAGKSTRMKSERPKVLHEVCGRPMLAYVLEACREADVERLVVVVGYQRELVLEAFGESDDLSWVDQTEQHGTGHAVMMCADVLGDFAGDVLVIAGDMPLIRSATLCALLEEHARTGQAVTLATTVLEDPAGYGRIVRTDARALAAIVEEKDCTPEQREIREVNPSYYCFDGPRLFAGLDRLSADNSQGEYYITDMVKILREQGQGAGAIAAVPPEDAMGINSRSDLAEVNRVMQRRIQRAWMDQGVTIVAPDLTWIESGALIGPETVVHPFVHVDAGAEVGEGCSLGPFARVRRGETVAAGAARPGNVRAGSGAVLGGRGVVLGRRRPTGNA